MWGRWILAVGMVGVLMLGACGSDAGYTIHVTGSSGTAFTGSILTTKADGTSSSQSVTGTAPNDYPVQGTSVSVSFQKSSGAVGLLKVELKKGDRVITSSETLAPYGVVTAAGR